MRLLLLSKFVFNFHCKLWSLVSQSVLFNKTLQITIDFNIFSKAKYPNFHRFNLYLKLFLAMGVNWSMEIISWAVEWKLKTVPKEIFIVTDFCNALYGVFIFLIFVCNKEKQKKLQKWYVSAYVVLKKQQYFYSYLTLLGIIRLLEGQCLRSLWPAVPPIQQEVLMLDQRKVLQTKRYCLLITETIINIFKNSFLCYFILLAVTLL